MMNNNILFERDSPEDLILRGFTRGYILEHTGFDAGYRNSNVRGKFDHIDRLAYKAFYVRSAYSDDEIKSILDKYISDIPTMTSALGLCGDKISFPKLFKIIGLSDMYKNAMKALKVKRIEDTNMRRYGVKHPLQSDVFKEKSKAVCIEKYGTEHPMKNESVKKKTKQTVIDRYGVNNVAQIEAVQQKMKSTMKEHYGVEHPLQNADIYAKCVATNNQRYGANAPLQNADVFSKMKLTMIKRYGVDNPGKSEEIKKKMVETSMRTYGTSHPMQSDMVKNKQRHTNIEKYGSPCALQNQEVHAKSVQTMVKKYGVTNPMYNETLKRKLVATNIERYGSPCSLQNKDARNKAIETNLSVYGTKHPMQNSHVKEKAAHTNMKRYGCRYTMQNEKVKQKSYQTKRERGTFNSSKPEEDLYVALVNQFGKDDVLQQYNLDERYPFNCDFYIKSRDMFIELNGYWSHGGHWFDKQNPCDINNLDKWSKLSSEHPLYASCIKTWINSDVKKRNTACTNNLNYVVFWNPSLDDAMLWFKMGCPDGHDYDTEYSWIPHHELTNPCL